MKYFLFPAILNWEETWCKYSNHNLDWSLGPLSYVHLRLFLHVHPQKLRLLKKKRKKERNTDKVTQMVICAQVTTADGGWLLFQLRLHIFTPRLFSLSDLFFFFLFFICLTCQQSVAPAVASLRCTSPSTPGCPPTHVGQAPRVVALTRRCVSARYEVDGCQRPACSGNDAVSLAGSPAWLPSNSTVSTCHRR